MTVPFRPVVAPAMLMLSGGAGGGAMLAEPT